MKILKSEIKYLITTILTWAFINFIANILGMWLTKLLNKTAFSYPENVLNEFIAPILIQSLLFGICTSVAYIFLKKKNLAFYIYVVFQFVAFHIIFAINSGFHNGIFFQSTFDDPGIIYLSYCGSYLIDILYLYFPINGFFENGVFMPTNVGTFYVHWFLLPLIYFLVITWISVSILKLVFKDNTKKSKTPDMESAESSLKQNEA